MENVCNKKFDKAKNGAKKTVTGTVFFKGKDYQI